MDRSAEAIVVGVGVEHGVVDQGATDAIPGDRIVDGVDQPPFKRALPARGSTRSPKQARVILC